MSPRAHLLLRLSALAVIAAAWMTPRGWVGSLGTGSTRVERVDHGVHAPNSAPAVAPAVVAAR